MVNNEQNKTIWDKLLQLDRRILYVILLLVIAIPTIYQVPITNKPLKMSEDLWTTIDQTPKDKIVLISSNWSKGTRGENQAQMAALINHLMMKRIRFALVSFDLTYSQVAQNLVDELAKQNNYIYGEDWLYLGFQPIPDTWIKTINIDMITNQRDGRLKRPLSDFQVMKGIKNATNIHMVVEISAAALHNYWIQFLRPGTNFGFCPTSVMAPESIPFYQSGQIKGMMWGAKGAYDYEQLNVEKLKGKYSYGKQYMGPLSAAFMLVFIAILIGNISLFMSKRNASARN